MVMTPQKSTKQTPLALAHYDHAKKMNSYAFLKTNNRATSEDLVQETFLKTSQYLVRKGHIELMRAFLYHVLNQLIIDEYRKRKTISLDLIIEKGHDPGVDTSQDLFDIIDGKVALLLLYKLSMKYQRVIRMRYIQDLSLEEIGLITGQSKNSVAVQVHRGVKKLKELYRHTHGS